MIHGASDSAPQTTTGAWYADRELVLTADGGKPQRYGVRTEEAVLFLSGGDLPLEVRFQRSDPP